MRRRGHIATAAAVIVLVVPEPADERMKVVDRYDLGQAIYAMMIAAGPRPAPPRALL